VLLSSEPLKQIQTFALKYELDAKEGITIASFDEESIFQFFPQGVGIPSAYLFDQAGNPLKEFKSAVKMSAIPKYL
jgi:hypothetical protein